MDKISNSYNNSISGNLYGKFAPQNAASPQFCGSKDLGDDVFQNEASSKKSSSKLGWFLGGAAALAVAGLAVLASCKKGDGRKIQNAAQKAIEEPATDLKKVLTETFEEIYGKYEKILKDKGVKDIPKPTLRFDDKIDDIANYGDVKNTLSCNLKLIKEYENHCYFEKDGMIGKRYISCDDDTKIPKTLFSKKDTESFAPQFHERGYTMHALGKDGAQMRAQGAVVHEMTHWMEDMAFMNDFKTHKKYMEHLNSIDPKHEKKHFFRNYKPSGAQIFFKQTIGDKKVVFSAEDMLSSHLQYPDMKERTLEDFFRYYSSPQEITAYVNEAGFLNSQIGKGFDENKLNALYSHCSTRAQTGYDILCGVIKEPGEFLRYI